MSGKDVCVFVVEDEPLLRLELEDTLTDLGLRIAKSVGKVDEALLVAATIECDVAILDVNIGGQRIDPVADRLMARGIPIIFTTGYGGSGRPANHAAAPVLEKPYPSSALSAAISHLI